MNDQDPYQQGNGHFHEPSMDQMVNIYTKGAIIAKATGHSDASWGSIFGFFLLWKVGSFVAMLIFACFVGFLAMDHNVHPRYYDSQDAVRQKRTDDRNAHIARYNCDPYSRPDCKDWDYPNRKPIGGR